MKLKGFSYLLKRVAHPDKYDFKAHSGLVNSVAVLASTLKACCFPGITPICT